MANHTDSEWAAERNVTQTHFTPEDKRAIAIFWASTATFVVVLLIASRFFFMH